MSQPKRKWESYTHQKRIALTSRAFEYCSPRIWLPCTRYRLIRPLGYVAKKLRKYLDKVDIAVIVEHGKGEDGGHKADGPKDDCASVYFYFFFFLAV